MDFFDKLGKKASEAYKVTADKTGKLAKEAKLRMKIGELKSQINDVYKEIGEITYQKHIREEEYDISKEIEEKCTKIDVLSDEMDSNLKECLELKDKRQCSSCFAEIEKDAKFCPECGAKQEIVVEPAKEVEIVNKEDSKQEDNSKNQGNQEKTESNNKESQEKSNLEKTVEVESDVDENHDETVEHLEVEDE